MSIRDLTAPCPVAFWVAATKGHRDRPAWVERLIPPGCAAATVPWG